MQQNSHLSEPQHPSNLEHNFGHGKHTLASVLVVLNLLAFALHTGCDLVETAWQKARKGFRARTRMFTHLATITEYHLFRSWSALMRTLTTGVPPPQPT